MGQAAASAFLGNELVLDAASHGTSWQRRWIHRPSTSCPHPQALNALLSGTFDALTAWGWAAGAAPSWTRISGGDAPVMTMAPGRRADKRCGFHGVCNSRLERAYD